MFVSHLTGESVGGPSRRAHRRTAALIDSEEGQAHEQVVHHHHVLGNVPVYVAPYEPGVHGESGGAGTNGGEPPPELLPHARKQE